MINAARAESCPLFLFPPPFQHPRQSRARTPADAAQKVGAPRARHEARRLEPGDAQRAQRGARRPGVRPQRGAHRGNLGARARRQQRGNLLRHGSDGDDRGSAIGALRLLRGDGGRRCRQAKEQLADDDRAALLQRPRRRRRRRRGARARPRRRHQPGGVMELGVGGSCAWVGCGGLSIIITWRRQCKAAVARRRRERRQAPASAARRRERSPGRTS